MPLPKVYRNRPVPEPSGQLIEEMSRSELYEMAQERDIEGRSMMTKDELIAALEG